MAAKNEELKQAQKALDDAKKNNAPAEAKLNESYDKLKGELGELQNEMQRLDATRAEAISNLKPSSAVSEYEKTASAISAGAAKSASASGLTRTYETESGTETRTGGTRAWRNNNPGNLRYGPFAIKHGAIGADKDGFAMFASMELGEAAKKDLLFKTASYKNLSLSGAISRYAPASDNNDTAKYQAAVIGAVGSNKKMSDYSEAEQQVIIDAMKKQEGFRVGKTSIASAASAASLSTPSPTPVNASSLNEIAAAKKAKQDAEAKQNQLEQAAINTDIEQADAKAAADKKTFTDKLTSTSPLADPATAFDQLLQETRTSNQLLTELLSTNERHVSIAQGQSGNLYAQ
jgi:predicted  nucleic acid-binding Zn-ribbon protein